MGGWDGGGPIGTGESGASCFDQKGWGRGRRKYDGRILKPNEPGRGAHSLVCGRTYCVLPTRSGPSWLSQHCVGQVTSVVFFPPRFLGPASCSVHMPQTLLEPHSHHEACLSQFDDRPEIQPKSIPWGDFSECFEEPLPTNSHQAGCPRPLFPEVDTSRQPQPPTCLPTS